MFMLFGLAWWNTAAAEPSELYQRLGLEKTATSAEMLAITYLLTYLLCYFTANRLLCFSLLLSLI